MPFFPLALDRWHPSSSSKKQSIAVDAATMLAAFQAAGIPADSNRKFVHARCPFHEERKGRSLYITADGRYASCYSGKCELNQTPGSWVEVAQKIGTTEGLLSYERDGGSSALSALTARFDRLEEFAAQQAAFSAVEEVTYPAGCQVWPKGRGWRGLRSAYLRRADARLRSDFGIRNDQRVSVNRIVFPVRYEPKGPLFGWVAEVEPVKLRRVISPKCRNMPEFDATRHLIGVEQAILNAERLNTKQVCLVEGPYDTHRWNQAGIPTAGILGTSTWFAFRKRSLSDPHPKLARLIEAGFRRILVAMDADAAGEKAAARVLEDARGVIPCEVLVLPSGTDPGSVKASFMKSVLSRFH